MTESASPQEQRRRDTLLGAMLGVFLIPVVFIGACLAIPYGLFLRWTRQRRELQLRALMRSQGRWIGWQDFLHAMRTRGGTCIEERFSPKGPVRFWWTPENVYRESPHEIIDWFTMRKGRRGEPFVHWCRQRYTGADQGSAVLVDSALVPKRQIYALWSECRSEASKARWVEVAPPEILPHRPGQ
ncbi:MAG: hypothetical protein ACLQG3_06415 [Terracidiphilus sp.]